MPRPEPGATRPVADSPGAQEPDAREPSQAAPAGSGLATPSLVETESFAAQMHAGQLDKAGEEYIGHPLRVRATVERTAPAAGVDPVHAQLAALLHDIVEDTPVTLADLAARGYPPAVVATVDALSKRPGELTEEYLARVAADSVAVVVKRADMADNGDPVRLARLPAAQGARLAARYAGRRVLLEELVAKVAASAAAPAAGKRAPAAGESTAPAEPPSG